MDNLKATNEELLDALESTAKLQNMTVEKHEKSNNDTGLSAKVEHTKDELGAVLYAPSMPGNKLGQSLPKRVIAKIAGVAK